MSAVQRLLSDGIERPPLLLTRDELRALTGAERAGSMIAWLDQRGWIYELDRKGHPQVARVYFDHRMTGRPLPGMRVGPRVDFLTS